MKRLNKRFALLSRLLMAPWSAFAGPTGTALSFGLTQRGQNHQVAQNLVGNGAEALARGLDKDAEYEADRHGAVPATRAGYEPYGLPTVLQKLGQLGRSDSSVGPAVQDASVAGRPAGTPGRRHGSIFDRYGDGPTLVQRFLPVRRSR
jgi:Zn-dependent protease with chaperone function